jgi:hypothetical protein
MPIGRQERSELHALAPSSDTPNKHSRQFKAQPNILASYTHEKNAGNFASVVAST